MDIIEAPNKDIKIEICDIEKSIFTEYDICRLKFKNNIDITIADIPFSIIDLGKFIDNIYFHLTSGQDTKFFLSGSNNNDGYIISFDTDLYNPLLNKDNRYKEIMKIDSLKYEEINNILNFEIDPLLLMNKLYENYIGK